MHGVKHRRELIIQFGGTCQRCGYSKSLRALHFHHKDSAEKRIWSKGDDRTSLNEIVAHPERFIVLCANCHAELHDEEAEKAHLYSPCEFCGKLRRIMPHHAGIGRGKFCNRTCQQAMRDVYARSQQSITDRFWKHARITEGCWEWEGYLLQRKYPCIQIKQDSGKYTGVLAHRVSYELHFGPIPEGTDVKRNCSNPKCVNPNHLYVKR